MKELRLIMDIKLSEYQSNFSNWNNSIFNDFDKNAFSHLETK